MKSRRNTLSYMRRTEGAATGAVNTAVIIYPTAAEFNGTDITYVSSANNGSSFLINTSGIYAVSANIICQANGHHTEIRVGATVDNSSNDTLTRTGCTDSAHADAGTWSSFLHWTGYIQAGLSVWTYTASAMTQARTQITITRIA